MLYLIQGFLGEDLQHCPTDQFNTFIVRLGVMPVAMANYGFIWHIENLVKINS